MKDENLIAGRLDVLFHPDRTLNPNSGKGHGGRTANNRRRILFIVNPEAAAGKCARRWEAFKRLLSRDAIEFEERFSQRPGHACELARDASGDHEVLAAVGGDGTVREVAQGILCAKGTRAALGVVPFGTGNDLARVLGVTAGGATLETIERGVSKLVDVIQITSQAEGRGVAHHALLFAGVGVIVDAQRKTTPAIKRVFGQRLSYPMGLALALLSYRAPNIRVTLDGTVFEEEFLFVGASNTETAGGGMRVAPGALLDDGRLNVNLVSAMGRGSALLQLRRLAYGAHVGHPKVHYLTAKTVRLDAGIPVEIAADGEIIGHTPAEIAVKPRALSVIVPPGVALCHA